MGRLRLVTGLAALGLGLSACGLVLGIDEGTPRGSVDGGIDAALDAVAADAAPDVIPLTDAGVDVVVDPCAALHGSTMVDVGKFCIDRTEVTNAQYAEFLASSPAVGKQPAECSWNSTFSPADPMGASNVPVGSVDWCDALAYCKYAGKSLCGSLTGAAVPLGAANFDPKSSAWMYACTHGGDGLHAYPYGNTVDNLACNTTTTAPVDVATNPKCEGGFAGVFDMIGNVKEWENSCRPSVDGGPSQDDCRRRGGGYNSGVNVACDVPETDTREYASPRSGIRCCKY